MNIKKSLILLTLIFGFSSCLPKQSVCKLAESLFMKIPSNVDQKSLDNFLKQIVIECAKEECKKADLLRLLIDECNQKIDYYHSVIMKKKKGYTTAFCLLGTSLLAVICMYWFYNTSQWENQRIEHKIEEENKIREWHVKNIKLTENKLHALGASLVSAYDGFAFATYRKSNIHEVEIKEMIRDLANSSALANLTSRSKVSSLRPLLHIGPIPIIMSAFAIRILFDQIYATCYYKKYYFIKEALEKQLEKLL